MPREKQDYRAILEDILSFTSGKRMLSGKDVANYLGIDRRTVKSRYGIGQGGISAPSLAILLARISA